MAKRIAVRNLRLCTKDCLCRLLTAIEKSARLVNEDLVREAGYMLPQSANTRALLERLVAAPPAGFPVEAARELLASIPCNEPENETG